MLALARCNFPLVIVKLIEKMDNGRSLREFGKYESVSETPEKINGKSRTLVSLMKHERRVHSLQQIFIKYENLNISLGCETDHLRKTVGKS